MVELTIWYDIYIQWWYIPLKPKSRDDSMDALAEMEGHYGHGVDNGHVFDVKSISSESRCSKSPWFFILSLHVFFQEKIGAGGVVDMWITWNDLVSENDESMWWRPHLSLSITGIIWEFHWEKHLWRMKFSGHGECIFPLQKSNIAMDHRHVSEVNQAARWAMFMHQNAKFFPWTFNPLKSHHTLLSPIKSHVSLKVGSICKTVRRRPNFRLMWKPKWVS